MWLPRKSTYIFPGDDKIVLSSSLHMGVGHQPHPFYTSSPLHLCALGIERNHFSLIMRMAVSVVGASENPPGLSEQCHEKTCLWEF